MTIVHMRTIDDITKEQRTKRGIALLVALFWFWVSTLPLPVSEQKRVDHNNGGVSVNDAQRQKIIQLRQAGQSFAQIADKVCLPKSTVKSFCYRHTASADDVKQEPRSTVCPQSRSLIAALSPDGSARMNAAQNTGRYMATRLSDAPRLI